MLISPYPAERVVAEAQTRLGAHLSGKGFALVASGPSGLTWRRDIQGGVIAGLAFLALMAIGGVGGGLADGDPATVLVGMACGAAAIFLLSARRPATVAVTVRSRPAGCEIDLRTTSNLPEIEILLRAVANASAEAASSSLDQAKSAYMAGRIDAHEFESAIADALDTDS